MMYLGMYKDAEEIFVSVISSDAATTKELRIAYDSWCQVSSRQVQTLVDGGEYIPALQCCRDLFQKFNGIPAAIKDDRIIGTILKFLPSLRRLAVHCARAPEADEVSGWVSLLTVLANPVTCDQHSETAQLPVAIDMLYGHIDRFAAAGTFGFIVSDDGAEHFFYQHNLVSGLQITMLRVGDRVSFRLGANDKGTVADGISLAPQTLMASL